MLRAPCVLRRAERLCPSAQTALACASMLGPTLVVALKRIGRIVITKSNLVLDVLPKRLQAELVSTGEFVQLSYGDVLLPEYAEPHCLYFPFTACFSLLASVDQHPAMEVALLGREGVLGMTLLGSAYARPLRAVVQSPGTALKVAMQAAPTQDDVALADLLKHSISQLLRQCANTAACANFHALRPRLAKRLLAAQDCLQTEHFTMTHQALADLLGVRRSAVSIAAKYLQHRGYIRYSRGNIRVMDRAGLESQSCSCYQVLDTDAPVYVRCSTDA